MMKSEMNIEFRLGTKNDIEEVSAMYDSLCDYIEVHGNYPGWKKGVYPSTQDAESGINDKCLYVAVCDHKIIGSIILRQYPEEAYDTVTWQKNLNYDLIYVLHTFLVHPDYLKCGVGMKLLQFTEELGKKNGIQALRLDVYDQNTPAINLYEKFGCKYIGTVDLGLSKYGLDYFKLYEKLI